MKTTWQRLLVLGVLSMGLVRCFSSSSGGGTTCNAFAEAQTNSECGTCVESQCSRRIASWVKVNTGSPVNGELRTG